MEPRPLSPLLTRRRAIASCGATAATLAIGGCGDAAERGFIVGTTFTVIADMVRNVAGEHATVESITKPGAEIHNYQPTPGDLLRTRDADLLIWNGLGLERWFERFFRDLGDVPEAVASRGIDPIAIGGGEYAGRPNPHAWMSPAAARTYVGNIAVALSVQDPGNAAAYERNAKAFAERIDAAAAPFRARFAALAPERRWLATSEGAFSYLARDFDLRELYLWPINADQQGTPQQIRHVIDLIARNDVPAIFSESTVSAKPAQQVAAETGAAYGGVLYVDSLSEADGPVPTYLALLTATLETIANGIGA